MEIYSFINTLKKYGFSCCRYDHAINNRTSSVSAHIHINGTPSHSRKTEKKSTAPQEIIFSVYKLFKYNNIVDFFLLSFFFLSSALSGSLRIMKAMRCVEPNTKTISRSTDNDIRVYHFIMDFFSSCARLLLLLLPLRFFFLLRFLNSLSEVVAKEERSKILT